MSIALSGVQLIIQSDLFNHEYDFRPNWTKFCDQLHCNHNYNKICSVLSFFKVSTQDIPRVFASSEKKKHSSACMWLRDCPVAQVWQCCPIY